MGIENSSAEQISKLELTETNKSDKLKEAMDLAKNDWKIQWKEIEALMTKFDKEAEDVKKALKENENYITLEARTEWKWLMDSLQIRVTGRGNKTYYWDNEKPAAPAKKEAIKSTNNKIDLKNVTAEADINLANKIYNVDAKLLNIRDAEWKIVWTLKKWEEVKLTWNKKWDFVETDKWYVSLKFLNEKKTVEPVQPESPAAEKQKWKPESNETSKSEYTLKSEEEIKKSITELDSSMNPLKEVIIGTYIDSEWKEQKIVLKWSSKNLSVELDWSWLIDDLDLKTNPEFASIKKTVDDLLKKYKSEVASKNDKVVDKKIVDSTPTDLNNPWPNDPVKFSAWSALTPWQKKWMGWADPTDKFIIARMPKN